MPRLRTRAVPSQQPRLDSVQLFQIEFNLKSMMQLNETLVARITVCTVCHVDSTYRGDRTFGTINLFIPMWRRLQQQRTATSHSRLARSAALQYRSQGMAPTAPPGSSRAH